MLPAQHRLTRGHEFALALRHGVRSGRPSVVVHLAAPSVRVGQDDPLASLRPTDPPRVGFVVSRAVGGSVVRHRVQRRLRHLMAPLLPDLPGGSLVVVRALPSSAARTSAELGAELEPALRSCLRKVAGGQPVVSS